jgi:hypothetical protein
LQRRRVKAVVGAEGLSRDCRDRVSGEEPARRARALPTASPGAAAERLPPQHQHPPRNRRRRLVPRPPRFGGLSRPQIRPAFASAWVIVRRLPNCPADAVSPKQQRGTASSVSVAAAGDSETRSLGGPRSGLLMRPSSAKSASTPWAWLHVLGAIGDGLPDVYEIRRDAWSTARGADPSEQGNEPMAVRVEKSMAPDRRNRSQLIPLSMPEDGVPPHVPRPRSPA